MPRLTTRSLLLALVLVPSALEAQPAQAGATADYRCTGRPTDGNANSKHPVCDVSAVVTHGPYLLAPTDTSATIVWMTDLPAVSKVLVGSGESSMREVVPERGGMRPVGTVHTVRLTGLEPGRRYSYRVVSTPVLDLAAYWPATGKEARSAAYSFTTFDARKPTTSFVSITDTHGHLSRIDSLARKIDWTGIDFLVHTGDAFDYLTDEQQVWTKWLDPLIAGGLGHGTPLIYARGNHETRGPFARALERYAPIEEGRFYYARDMGPVHMLVVDSGEDKHDTTQVYAGLNRMEAYHADELTWFRAHARTSRRLKEAPFRILVMHQPRWGWLRSDNDVAQREWTDAANAAGVDLIIAGHNHRYSLTPAGSPAGNQYPILVVGVGQVAKVDATATEARVTVLDQDGSVRHTFTVPRR